MVNWIDLIPFYEYLYPELEPHVDATTRNAKDMNNFWEELLLGVIFCRYVLTVVYGKIPVNLARPLSSPKLNKSFEQFWNWLSDEGTDDQEKRYQYEALRNFRRSKIAILKTLVFYFFACFMVALLIWILHTKGKKGSFSTFQRILKCGESDLFEKFVEQRVKENLLMYEITKNEVVSQLRKLNKVMLEGQLHNTKKIYNTYDDLSHCVDGRMQYFKQDKTRIIRAPLLEPLRKNKEENARLQSPKAYRQRNDLNRSSQINKRKNIQCDVMETGDFAHFSK